MGCKGSHLSVINRVGQMLLAVYLCGTLRAIFIIMKGIIMSSTHIFLKYDGTSDALQNHRMEAKQLGQMLIELSDLIYDSNLTLNGLDSFIDVQAQAGFMEGSFGLELIVDQQLVEGMVEVAKYIGFGASAVTGSLLSILKHRNARNIKDDQIVIDESSGTAVITINDEKLETTPEVIKLLQTRSVRNQLDKVVKQQLDMPGVDVFKVLDSSDEQNSVLEVNKEDAQGFKVPPRKKAETVDELDTVANIEFIHSNKNSGSSGWRMIHNGEESSVKITDEVFLESIKREESLSIYGMKYRVDLSYKKTISASGDRVSYTITKVRSRVKD